MLKTGLALLFTLFLTGCSNLAYYSQAVGGHLEVMRSTRPIQDLVTDPTTDPGLKKKLEDVNAIRDFASRELALPDNDSYRAYADLGRPFVVWNVSAAPEFSLTPENWCMVFVGCVSYRGFYDRNEAEQLATELRQNGFDTYVGGVPAYSTLGFFSDPVLNTFLRFGDIEVARLIFHELAHQLVFAEGDSVFNESFATTVENEGVQRWLARAAKQDLGKGFVTEQRRKEQFVGLVSEYRGKLHKLYAAESSPDAKRRAKGEIIADMKRAYGDLKVRWGGYSGYDKWFEQDLNNAKMASLAIYTQLLPAFEALLDAEGRDLPRFYRRAAALAGMPRDERQVALNSLLTTKSTSTLAAQSSPQRSVQTETVAVQAAVARQE